MWWENGFFSGQGVEGWKVSNEPYKNGRKRKGLWTRVEKEREREGGGVGGGSLTHREPSRVNIQKRGEADEERIKISQSPHVREAQRKG